MVVLNQNCFILNLNYNTRWFGSWRSLVFEFDARGRARSARLTALDRGRALRGRSARAESAATRVPCEHARALEHDDEHHGGTELEHVEEDEHADNVARGAVDGGPQQIGSLAEQTEGAHGRGDDELCAVVSERIVKSEL